MKLNRVKKVMTGMVLALILISVAGMIPQSTAQAQSRDRYGRWDRRDDRYRDRDWRYRNRDRGRYNDRYRYEDYNSGRYPNYGGYNRANVYNIARQYGYQDGLDKAREDIRDRDSYNLNRHERYRDADRGYRSQYGDKNAYRAAYRNGFRQGYDQVFRQYGGYRRW